MAAAQGLPALQDDAPLNASHGYSAHRVSVLTGDVSTSAGCRTVSPGRNASQVTLVPVDAPARRMLSSARSDLSHFISFVCLPSTTGHHRACGCRPLRQRSPGSPPRAVCFVNHVTPCAGRSMGESFTAVSLASASELLRRHARRLTDQSPCCLEQEAGVPRKGVELQAQCLRRLASADARTSSSLGSNMPSMGELEDGLQVCGFLSESTLGRLERLKTEDEINNKVKGQLAEMQKQLQQERQQRVELQAKFTALECSVEQQGIELQTARQQHQSIHEESLRQQRQLVDQLALERQQTEELRQAASAARQEAVRFRAEAETAHAELTRLADEAAERAARLHKEKETLSEEIGGYRREILEQSLRIEQQTARLASLTEEDYRESLERATDVLKSTTEELQQEHKAAAAASAAREASLLAELSSLRRESDQKLQEAQQEVNLAQEKLTRTAAALAKERKSAEVFRQKFERMAEDLEGQTAECQRVRGDLAALERQHRQLMEEIQRERESLAEQQQQHQQQAPAEQTSQTRTQRSEAKGIAKRFVQGLASRDLDAQHSARSVEATRESQSEEQRHWQNAYLQAAAFRWKSKAQRYKRLCRVFHMKSIQLHQERQALIAHLQALRRDGANAIYELLSTQTPPLPPIDGRNIIRQQQQRHTQPRTSSSGNLRATPFVPQPFLVRGDNVPLPPGSGGGSVALHTVKRVPSVQHVQRESENAAAAATALPLPLKPRSALFSRRPSYCCSSARSTIPVAPSGVTESLKAARRLQESAATEILPLFLPRVGVTPACTSASPSAPLLAGLMAKGQPPVGRSLSLGAPARGPPGGASRKVCPFHGGPQGTLQGRAPPPPKPPLELRLRKACTFSEAVPVPAGIAPPLQAGDGAPGWTTVRSDGL
ncbi:hypothetical protein cyc_04984 [Cyclospora cayetanensis]|uniref:Uncharacterized protein n=1 Tax=Cyclospora cayetanensis TaxID=88456 RepID=A0A1D3CTA7_9EIME|nr:hypothetical protein cyc_04984 [Cyclospora cayetanensis]